MKTLKALVMVMLLSGTASAGTGGYPAEAAMMSAGARAAAVRQIGHVPSVGVIDLRIRHTPRFRGNETDVSEYRMTASKYAGGIATLRAALSANPQTRNALAARGISINRIVGIRIGSNGSIRVYLL